MIPEISPIPLQEALQSSEPPLLLDVREPEEYQLTRLPNAIHVPLMELESRLGELKTHLETRPNAELVVYCRVGQRSAFAVQMLLGVGVAKAKNLQGGIIAYAQQVDSSLVIY